MYYNSIRQWAWSSCLYLVCISLIPRPSLAVCKNGGGFWGKAWGISSCDPCHNHHMSSHFLSTAKWCRRRILHSVLATKRGQASAESYTEHMRDTQAKHHDSKRLLSDKRRRWCSHLVERKTADMGGLSLNTETHSRVCAPAMGAAYVTMVQGALVCAGTEM